MYFDLTGIRNDRMELDVTRILNFAEKALFPHEPGVEIRFESCLDLDSIDGYCTQEEHDDYLIELNTHLKGDDLIRTVIHELIHVKQYSEGKLEQIHVDGKGPRMYWKSVDMTDASYDERPWECEAHSLENELYLQYTANGV